MKEKEKEIVGELLSPDTIRQDILETFEYEYPGSEVDLNISTDEFTCVCPKSGLPDFATISIKYVPDLKCVELKSLKFYLMSYRQVGIFHEHVVNRILGDFVDVVEPIRVTVFGDFKIRGGVHTTSEVSWEKEKK
ncbi:MAG: NADPH-dependent 7-cyano-7-deazaguanine reductase QueF [Candidatus Marinimicrobia bacterium]|nr:NADPH-dependent 7-cyano-7-deazaguanine reductase QueF [Candidatus Neomarinimicrobiota bacterium]